MAHLLLRRHRTPTVARSAPYGSTGLDGPTTAKPAGRSPGAPGFRQRCRDVRASLRALPALDPALPPGKPAWPSRQDAPMTWAVHRLDDAWRRLRHGLPRLVHLLRAPRPDRTNAIGRTDLMLAALSGNTARVRLLAPWAEVDRRDALGRTALMHAARKGRLGAVRALLPYANPNLQDHAGETALTLTITSSDLRGDFPTIAHLLGPLSDPNVRYRNTAVLTMTVVHGIPELAREMAGRADALRIDTGSGSRPVLDIVLERRDWLTATALFEAWPLACTWPSIDAAAQPWPEKDRPPELQRLWDRAHAGVVTEEKDALRAVLAATTLDEPSTLPRTTESGALRTVRARL